MMKRIFVLALLLSSCSCKVVQTNRRIQEWKRELSRRRLRSFPERQEQKKKNNNREDNNSVECQEGFSGGGGVGGGNFGQGNKPPRPPGNIHAPPPGGVGEFSGGFGMGNSSSSDSSDSSTTNTTNSGFNGGVGGGNGGNPERPHGNWEDCFTSVPVASPIAPSAAFSPTLSSPSSPTIPTDFGNERIAHLLEYAVSVGVEPNEERRFLQWAELLLDVATVMTDIVNRTTPYHFFILERRRLTQTMLQFDHENSHFHNLTTVESSGVNWWRCTVAYELQFSNENTSDVDTVIDAAVRDAVKNGEFLEELEQISEQVVQVALPGYEYNATIPTVSDPVIEVPLDTDDWDLRRWVGLGLFGGTLLFVLLLTHTARHRRKKWEEQEHWGVRLATDHDINQLLTYGWQQDGQRLTFYDKTKLCYNEDDSMLIGGLPYPREITSPSSGTSQ